MLLSEDPAGVSDTRQSFRSNYFCDAPGATSDTVADHFDLVSLDSDGFTINVTTAPGAAIRVGYVALGGPALSVKVGTYTSQTTTGTKATIGVGFQPEAIILGGLATALDTIETSMNGILGLATGTSERAYTACVSGDNDPPSNTHRRLSTSACVGWVRASDGAVQMEADLSSFDADGFTLNYTTVTGETVARNYFYIALKIAPVVGAGPAGNVFAIAS